MTLRSLAFLIVVLAGFASPARAAENALDLLDTATAYSADFTVTSDKGTYGGRVWHQSGRERRDFETKGGSQSILIRRDLDGAWLLKPAGKWYVGLGLKAVGGLAGGVDQLIVERTRTGEDWVAGHRAVRYRVQGDGPQGGRFDGTAWFSREGIMVKAEGTLIDGGGRKSPVRTELSRLKIGRVDDKVFDLPSGWFGMDLRQVPAERIAQAIESLRPLLEGR
jgi:outer membrane lipoprotein-sorting protein